MSQRAVIIGGGVIGLFSAYYAAKEGFEVTVLERESEEHVGCSVGNAGMIVPSHFTPLAAPGMISYGLKQMLRPSSPFGIRHSPGVAKWCLLFAAACKQGRSEAAKPLLAKLNLMTMEAYSGLEDELGDFGLTKKGLVMLCKTRAALDAESQLADEAPRLGMEAHVLTRDEVQKLDPAIEMDILGGVYFPGDGHLTPGRLVQLLRTKLRAMGVALEFNCDVTGVDINAGGIRAVNATDRHWVADHFVLAAGSWSGRLARLFSLNLPLVAGKGYSFDLSSPPQMPSLCSILVEGRVAVTPMLHGLRVAGTMELGNDDSNVNAKRALGIRRSLASYFPQLSENVSVGVSNWSGLRPCSPDGLPYLGRAASSTNLIVATGHSMMGLSLAPVTGQIVRDLLANRPAALNIDLLKVDRYA